MSHFGYGFIFVMFRFAYQAWFPPTSVLCLLLFGLQQRGANIFTPLATKGSKIRQKAQTDAWRVLVTHLMRERNNMESGP